MFHNTYAGISLGYLYPTAFLLCILKWSRTKISAIRKPQWDEGLMTAAFVKGEVRCLHCLCLFLLFFFFSFGKYNWVIESRAYILILISRQLSPVPWAVLPFDQIVSQSEFEISFGKEMRIPPILPFCSFDKYLNWTLFCFLYPVSCIISSISIKFAVPWARPITFLDGGIA